MRRIVFWTETRSALAGWNAVVFKNEHTPNESIQKLRALSEEDQPDIRVVHHQCGDTCGKQHTRIYLWRALQHIKQCTNDIIFDVIYKKKNTHTLLRLIERTFSACVLPPYQLRVNPNTNTLRERGLCDGDECRVIAATTGVAAMDCIYIHDIALD